MAALDFIIRGDNSDFLNKLKQVQDGVKNTADKIEESGMSIEDMFSRLTKAAAAFGAGFSAMEFVKQIAQVRGEFQQLEVAFTTMLGGSQEAANDLMKQLVQLAAITPFNLKDVADGARQLLAYGEDVNKITDDLTRLGNISAGLSQPLGDLVYLYGTTMTQGRLYTEDLNQFTGRGIPMIRELAKVFGVAENEVKNLVTEGKVGFPEVQKVIQNLTNEGGMFYNLMQEQSKTITGQISNIEDSISTMFNNIGKSSEGVINTALDGVSYLVENYESIGDAIMSVVIAYGSYKAVLMSVSAYQSAVTGIKYTAEIAELSKLIPAKQQEAKSDLEQAVASGKLSQAKAAQITTMRAEAAEYVKSLQLKAQEATANYNAATSASASAALKLEAAETSLASAQMEYNSAVRSGNAKAIEAAETQLAIAQSNRYSSAKALETARANVATAATNASTASKAAETASTSFNTISTSANTKATNLLTAAKTRLLAVSKSLGLSLLANPYILTAAAVTSLVVATYKYVTAASAADEAQNSFNKNLDENSKKIEERKQRISELIQTIRNADTTDLQKQLAFDELGKIAPVLTQVYDSIDKLSKVDISDFNKQLNDITDKEHEDNIRNQIELFKQYVDILESNDRSVKGRSAVQGLKDLGLVGNWTMFFDDWAEAGRKEIELLYGELQKIEDAKEKVSQPTELDVKVAENSYKESKERLDAIEKFSLALKYEIESNTIEIPLDEESPQRKTDEIVSEIEGKIEALKEEQRNNPIQFTADKQQVLDQYSSMLTQIQAWKARARATGVFTIPLFVTQVRNETLQKKQKLNYLTGKYESEEEKATTLAEDYKAAEKAYNNARASLAKMNSNRSKYTSEDYKKAVADLKSAKKDFEELGGITQTDKQRQSAATKAENERKKTAEKRKKAQEELNKDLLALQQKNQDDEIALMQDGTQKKLAEIDNDYKKRIAEIDRQEAEFKKKNKEAGATGLTDGLTKEQQTELQEARDNAAKEQEKQTNEVYLAEAQAMRDYLKQYGTFQQQKLAIAEEYAEKIKNAQNEGERLSLTAERDRSLQQVEINAIKQNIDWGSVFGDFGTMFRDQLQPTIDQLRQIAQSDTFKQSSLEDQKTLYELIDKLEQSNTAWDSDIFKRLSDDIIAYQEAMRNYNDAVEKARKAQEDYTNAQNAHNAAVKAGDTAVIQSTQAAVDATKETFVQASDQVKTFGSQVQSTTSDLNTSAIKAKNMFEDLASGLQGLSSGSLQGIGKGILQIGDLFTEGKFTEKAGNAVAKGFQSIFGKDSKASKALSEALGSSGMAGQIISAILSMLDVLAQGGVGGIISSLTDTVYGAINGILEDVLSGGIIMKPLESVGKGIGSILNTLTFGGFNSWFGQKESDPHLEEDIKSLTQSNNDLKQAIDNLSDKIDNAPVSEVMDIYEQQKKNLSEVEANMLEEMSRSAAAYKSGGLFSSGTRSSNYRIDKGMDASDWEAISKSVGRTINSASDFWTLTSEEMYNVATEATAQYTKIKDLADDGYKDAAQFMDEYIELWKQVEDLENTAYENLTDISFDSVRDDFKNTLLDMESDTDDFIDNFNKMMQQAAVSSLTDNYEQDLKDWYKSFGEAMSDGMLNDEEINTLRNNWNDIIDSAVSERDALKNAMGWTDTEQSQQSASSKGFATASQDSIDELNGRFTAMYEVGLNIKSINSSIGTSIINTLTAINSLVSLSTNGNEELKNILNQQVIANSYLEDIVKYTKPIMSLGLKLDTIVSKVNNL